MDPLQHSPSREQPPKLTVTCTEWRPYRKNTLRGFANVTINEMRLEIRDVGIHVRGERRWAGLPARPMIKDGRVVTGDDGKPEYAPVLNFVSRAVADRFSEAVIDAVLRHRPDALDEAAA
jgi:hypothetical protein